MAKSLSSLWLKSMRRVSKAQQAQGMRLFESMLPKVALAKKPRRPTLKTLKLLAATPGTPANTAQKTRRPTAAQARAAAGLPGTWRKAWFTLPGDGPLSDTRRMLYWLYLPAGVPDPITTAATPAAPRPLVVMLHGCEQSAADFAAGSRMNQLAERKGFAVLYPQQSSTADAHRCWHWYKRATQKGEGDIAVIAAMVAQVQQKHGLDTTRTYVAGLSAGAALAAIVALRHPGLFAAVGMHSAPVFGTTHSPFSAYRAMQHGSASSYGAAAREFTGAQAQFPGMPAILIHGDSDSVVRRVNADQLAEQFEIINGPVLAQSASREGPALRRYPERRGGRKPRHAYQTSTWYAGRKPQLVKCDVNALGHAWSGGDGSVKFSEPQGPDATLMMWTFFSYHRRIPALPQA
ncbi:MULTISPECIES: PHB depolymerase family esterase [unclassified Polaromonas]|uniref:extracellular catalytic domain type 1 short-chain-length polyhydroxyalkanoate depolymerase n=1 Tax=unclassified Polaromonas TaxID=2638319 RepID=UPI000F0778A4|nr:MULTISPECIES: PHB depolymerase family esterase [unclassified Polaromonas]AYQ29646.1 esterase [Polaromonas sp. SP1]QGJ19240.1 PHB depolymerase family esterase [Polaromonas sp. Pch-P]